MYFVQYWISINTNNDIIIIIATYIVLSMPFRIKSELELNSAQHMTSVYCFYEVCAKIIGSRMFLFLFLYNCNICKQTIPCGTFTPLWHYYVTQYRVSRLRRSDIITLLKHQYKHIRVDHYIYIINELEISQTIE